MNCFSIRFVFLFLLGPVYLRYSYPVCSLCVSCLLLSACQYQCNQLPGKTHLWNDLLCIEYSIVQQSSNILISKKVFRFEFVFWPFEIRLPNTGWSKFREINTMPALNSGHRRAINRSSVPNVFTWCCEVTYGWGRCLPALVLAYAVTTLRSSLMVITSLRPWRRSAWVGP